MEQTDDSLDEINTRASEWFPLWIRDVYTSGLAPREGSSTVLRSEVDLARGLLCLNTRGMKKATNNRCSKNSLQIAKCSSG